jgi:hypothetical protein
MASGARTRTAPIGLRVTLSFATTPSALKPLTIRARTRILPGSMLRLLVALLPTLRSAMRSRRDLVVENLALRQQLVTPGRPTTPRHPTRRSGLLDPAASLLERLGREPHHRPARHSRALAPRRLPHLLELAVQVRRALRPPSPAARGPRPHQEDGVRELLGRAPHPRRTAAPRLRGLRAQRLAPPARPASQPESRPDLDDLPPKPPKRHRRDGLLLCAHGHVPRPPCALGVALPRRR